MPKQKLPQRLLMLLDQLFYTLPETALEYESGGSGSDAACDYQNNLQDFSNKFNEIFEHQLPSLNSNDSLWDDDKNYLGPKK